MALPWWQHHKHCRAYYYYSTQGDHSPDNLKFPDDSLSFPWRFTALLRGTRHVKCYSYHARSSATVSGGVGMQQYMIQNLYLTFKTQQTLLNTCMDTNMQFTINSFRQLFPDKTFSLTIPTFPWFSVESLTFPWQLSNSLTFPGFPDKWSPCQLFCASYKHLGVYLPNSDSVARCILSSSVCLCVCVVNAITSEPFVTSSFNFRNSWSCCDALQHVIANGAVR